ncbi:anthranilate synthase component I family protein [uncultured Methanobrevibacter sp.]|uniref:anthranilate synthase component I family protein n=1 Tax=uncultured Methanobrevibacter sp. TaxID=253161 RepID=UPI0026162673
MFYPNIEEVKEMAKDESYKRIPICLEIFSDSKTSIEVLRRLRILSNHCYMLESVEDSKNWGRYSFLGFNPILELTCQDGQLRIKGESSFSDCELEEEDAKCFTCNTDNPAHYIRQIIAENKSPKIKGLPSFSGGLVGYFSYDYIKYSEPSLVLDAQNQDAFKDVDLMLFDKVIAFDNFKQKIVVIVNMKVNGEDSKSLEESYDEACRSIEDIINVIKADNIVDLLDESFSQQLSNKKTIEALAKMEDLKSLEEVDACRKEITKHLPIKIKSDYKYLFSKEEFCDMIEKAKNYITEGDIFQVVLSNRIEAEIEGSLFDVYRVLRTTNPSPYMFYFSSDDIEIAGASPETLVKLVDNHVYTFPLAGTRPRGKTDEEDLLLEKELLSDKKELAEHNMLVDLGRNDIGKISEIGSVKVNRYMDIVRFSHVMHIGSTVEANLRKDCDYLSAIDSILPAGTLSGAPKIRACEIINELEDNKRGIYGGAIGYIDLTGNLDTCIAIRIAFARDNKVFIRSGAGIVADSVAENEFTECINKAQAVIDALNIADGGIR